MQMPCNRLRARVARSGKEFLGISGCVAFALFLYSCASIPTASRDALAANAAPMRYSIVSIIHGDADYVFHDSLGVEHIADDDALAKARTVAEQNPFAEAFIFHEIPQQHFLVFFPLNDGEFYYYRGGRLIDSETYSRAAGDQRFASELALYDRFHVAEQSPQTRFFLYFGHEIPEFTGYGYDVSHPERMFTINDLAEGLQHITGDTARFDLAVMSTCYNGTPHTIAVLAPYARFLIASPENLHLSYFDLHPLEHLEIGLQNTDIGAFAKAFAQNAFDTLSANVETTITVAVYDADRTKPFLRNAGAAYERTMKTIATLTNVPPESIAHCDCGDNAAYASKGINDGVLIFYRPPEFGRAKDITTHSGWECWKDKVWQTENKQLIEGIQK